jgi:hypothetical protein
VAEERQTASLAGRVADHALGEPLGEPDARALGHGLHSRSEHAALHRAELLSGGLAEEAREAGHPFEGEQEVGAQGGEEPQRAPGRLEGRGEERVDLSALGGPQGEELLHLLDDEENAGAGRRLIGDQRAEGGGPSA